MRFFLFQILFGLFALSAIGQTSDTSTVLRKSDAAVVLEKQDTLTTKAKTGWLKNFFQKGYPSPKKAVLLSLAIPGAGQIYNHSWWKLPIVYGGLGGMIWLVGHNNAEYQRRKTAYYNTVNNLPVEAPYNSYDAYSLKFLRDDAHANLELSGIFLGLAYLFVTADAFVSAHLKKFDVSDDLSLKITPGPGQLLAPGLCLQVNLSGKPRQSVPILLDKSPNHPTK